MFLLTPLRHLTLTLLACLTLFSAPSHAETLYPFKATFNVRVFGFNVGEAKQSLSCQQQNCLLTSEASPPKWAQRFINESAIEKIKLIQNDKEFKWLEYKKYLTRHYDDHTEHKTYTLVRDDKRHRVHYVEENKNWPLHKLVYDTISIAYAIQYRVRNHLPLKDMYFQDDKVQQKILFSVTNQPDEIDLDFKDELQTKRFEFHNDKMSVKLWLVPEIRDFPGQIEIENKAEKRTITLELNRVPDFSN
ncbi:MAG: DUF3108 domain-containing protein [Thiotrichales bacterium]|nr:DUF3108 domain-containing protein [Thiotrichales bacterium]